MLHLHAFFTSCRKILSYCTSLFKELWSLFHILCCALFSVIIKRQVCTLTILSQQNFMVTPLSFTDFYFIKLISCPVILSLVKQYYLNFTGESAVGKSSLVLRFVKGQFHEYQESTIGGE